ncbi:rhomboid family intramembrane serine protease [Geothrix terrae]|uniref:rhomboid family intramembrane serine protease n=1 Tax=Geothrix terrae TaxID=2922720 RepID=UPI001FAD1728|nr:rhomboid family intramembrane serine protease [Geothrix terrae]
MDPLALTAEALREPWRLWTGHLVHFGWEHALANAVALAVPWILAPPEDRRRLALAMLVLPPLLSLLLLPSLGGGDYRGASGLACALWGLVGLRLTGRQGSTPLGLLMLGGLMLKLGTEAAFGGCFLLHPEGWRTLPGAHLWGTLLGLASALPPWPRPHPA